MKEIDYDKIGLLLIQKRKAEEFCRVFDSVEVDHDQAYIKVTAGHNGSTKAEFIWHKKDSFKVLKTAISSFATIQCNKTVKELKKLGVEVDNSAEIDL